MKYLPTLTIAGSDSSGGAGIQADLKTMSALGCYAMSVITAVTAQNTQGVKGIHPIPAEMVTLQLTTVLQDIPPRAIKIGMLFGTPIIEVVAEQLAHVDTPLIIDPVMVATSGDRLLSREAEKSLKKNLIPLATLITPNRMEAEALAGKSINSVRDLLQAGRKLEELGAKAVLIKGGHTDERRAVDYLFTSGEHFTFEAERVKSPNTHGTGCTLSAAITAYVARGESLGSAIRQAKQYLTQALISGSEVVIGHGHGPVDHFFSPLKSIKR